MSVELARPSLTPALVSQIPAPTSLSARDQSYSSHSESNHCESPPMYLTRDPRPDIRPPAISPDSNLSPTPINREVLSSSLLSDGMNDVESPVQTLKKKDESNRTGVDDLEACSVSFEDETQKRVPQTRSETPSRQTHLTDSFRRLGPKRTSRCNDDSTRANS